MGDGPVVDLRLDDLLADLERLPAQTSAPLRVIRLVNSADSSAREVAAELRADPALLSRVLRTANSPYYGLSGRVGNSTVAVTVLGMATVGSLAAAAAARLDRSAGLPAGFWQDATRVAVAAGLTAPLFGVGAADAFCAGVLMDVGRALLLRCDPAGYTGLVDRVVGTGSATLALERARYGLSHPQVAERVLRAWRFPPEMCTAIGGHHEHLPAGADGLARVLAVAQALAACDRAEPGDGAVAEVARLSEGRIGPGHLATLLPRVTDEAGALAAAVAG